MSISKYEASVPVFIHGLANLAAILGKAKDHVDAKKIEPEALLGLRLFPDMFPLTRQVQVAADLAKGPAARLANIERPVYEDTEKSFEQLHTRIEKTIAFLKTLKPEQIDGSEDREIKLTIRGNDVAFRGKPYLLYFALPNFYFHITTTYALLRHAGVELGKMDYVGPLHH